MAKNKAMKKSTLIPLFLAILVVLVVHSPLFAQVPRPRPIAAEEEEAILKKKPYEEFKPKPKVKIEKEEEEEVPRAEAEKKTFIRKIDVVGNIIIPPKIIDKIVLEYENRELTLSDLMELADKITAIYVSKGYLTSQAYVPPQKVEDETAIIEVLEGEYGEFDIEGCRYTRETIVKKRLKKKPGKIFNYTELRKDLMYLNENPDRIVTAAMVPGKSDKTTDFKIRVKDRPPIHAGYEINNTGTKVTGLWRNIYRLEDTGLFLYDDTFLARYIHSENHNLRGVAANYTLPLNEFGAKFGVSASHFRVNVGHDFEDLLVKSRSTSYSFYLQHPVFDFDWLSGKMDTSLDIKEGRTEAMPDWGQRVERSSRDRLRIVKTGITMEESDEWGRFVMRNELSWQPENFLGSCDNISSTGDASINDPDGDGIGPGENDSSRQNADGSFMKYSFRLSRLNRLPFSSILLLNLEGQATNNLLYGSEQHRIGGTYTVRGYNEGAALGDYGANASAEVRFPFHIIPKDFNICGANLRQTVQGVGFVDWGFVHAKTPVTQTTAPQRNNNTMVGTGFGLRLDFMNCITGRFDIAWPVGNRSAYGREPRIHIYFKMEEPTLAQQQAMVERRHKAKIERERKKELRKAERKRKKEEARIKREKRKAELKARKEAQKTN